MIYPPCTLYIIACDTPRHFYIGTTLRLKEKRFLEHFSKEGCAWTVRHGCKKVLKSFPVPKNRASALENEMLCFFCQKYGWQGVRGGDFTYSKLDKDGICRPPEWAFKNLEIKGFKIRENP